MSNHSNNILSFVKFNFCACGLRARLDMHILGLDVKAQ